MTQEFDMWRREALKKRGAEKTEELFVSTFLHAFFVTYILHNVIS